MNTSVSFIIVSYNTVDYLRECLESVYKHTNNIHEVIVVDNDSHDGSIAMVKNEFPDVKLIETGENLGFGVGNNVGVEHATGEYVMLFNSDALLTTDSAKILSQYLIDNPNVSCVCPRVVLPKTHIIQPKTFGFKPTAKRVWMQSLGLNRLFPSSTFFRGTDGEHRWSKEMKVGWVSGVCMVMRKEHYQAVQGFDDRFFMYCEDVELSLKLERFGDVVLYDDAEIIHYGGASSKSIESKVRNSVWQQQHLLIIVKDYFGKNQATLAKLGLFIGLFIRMCAGIIFIPKRGIKNNEGLQSAWARLKSLFNNQRFKKANS